MSEKPSPEVVRHTANPIMDAQQGPNAQLEIEQQERLQLEQKLALLQAQLAEQPAAPMELAQQSNAPGDQQVLLQQLMSEQHARSKLEENMVALQAQLAQQPALLEGRLAASLAGEREARGQLQQQLEDLHVKLQSQQSTPQQQQQQYEPAPEYGDGTKDAANGAFRVTLVKGNPNEKYGLQLHQSDVAPRTVSVANIVPGSLAASSQQISIGDEVNFTCALL